MKTRLSMSPGLGITEHLFFLFGPKLWSQGKSSEHLCLDGHLARPVTTVTEIQPHLCHALPLPPQPKKGGPCLVRTQWNSRLKLGDDHLSRTSTTLHSRLRSLPAHATSSLSLSWQMFHRCFRFNIFSSHYPKPEFSTVHGSAIYPVVQEEYLEVILDFIFSLHGTSLFLIFSELDIMYLLCFLLPSPIVQPTLLLSWRSYSTRRLVSTFAGLQSVHSLCTCGPRVAITFYS